jgi:DNA-binding transcriptional regulator YdaS (Cro superfamily)
MKPGPKPTPAWIASYCRRAVVLRRAYSDKALARRFNLHPATINAFGNGRRNVAGENQHED